MNNIGKDPAAVRAKYQMICPKCGKPAVRREPKPDGTVAYLHLTKHGAVRHFVEPVTPAKKSRKRSATGSALAMTGTKDAGAKKRKEAG